MRKRPQVKREKLYILVPLMEHFLLLLLNKWPHIFILHLVPWVVYPALPVLLRFWNSLPSSSRPVSCSFAVGILQGTFLNVSPLSCLLPFTHSSRFFSQFSFLYSKFVFGGEAPTFMASDTWRGINLSHFQNHIFNQSVPQKPKIKSLSPQLQTPSLSLPIHFLPWFIPQTWNLYHLFFQTSG